MDTLKRLEQLMRQQHLSVYKLSQITGVPLSTINSLFTKGNSPTLPTLQGLCKGLDISLSDFFYEADLPERVNDEELKLLEQWNLLNKKQKEVLQDLLDLLLETDEGE